MRNLKKILALVLALVMSFAVMSVSSASFKDQDKIGDQFEEAIGVLSALGVFQGDEKGNFNPQGSITRAEVAAIIYRIDTGDVYDAQVEIYSDYNRFEDVKSTDWYAGYVNYCANAQYIRGTSDTTFDPEANVTGYQALAMILRAVGYDKNGEFSGSAWQIETAKYANQLGITSTVSANTLGAPATRELVAELLFRTIAYVPQVTYTLALGYNQYQSTIIVDPDTAKLNPTIGEEMFGLWFEELVTVDNWGRPGDIWYSWNSAIYVMPYTPVATYTVVTTECQIAQDLGIGSTRNVLTFDNGYETRTQIVATKEHIHVEDEQVGGQGTLVEVYNTDEGLDYWSGNNGRIVLIETFLAEVTKTVKEVTDKAGHVIIPATNTLKVYFGDDEGYTVDSNEFVVYGNEYATGDYVLVNLDRDADEAWENGVLFEKEYVEAVPVCEAPAITAAQTNVWWNAEKHTLDKVEYADNENFALDACGLTIGTNYTWFLDEYNNVIGSAVITSPKQYIVVEGAQWVNGIGQRGYAAANIRYMDGTSGTAEIAMVNNNWVYYADFEAVGKTFNDGAIYTTYQYNSNTYAHLYEVVGTDPYYGGLILEEVTDEHVTDIYSGTSEIVDNKVYADNNTQFLFFNPTTWTWTPVTGYDNLGASYKNVTIDVVDIDADPYAEYIYVIGSANNTSYGNRYVFFTGKTMNFYEVRNTFALYGLIDSEGNSDPLYFSKGDDAYATKEALIEMIQMYKNTLCYVETTNGVVTSIIPVPMDTHIDNGDAVVEDGIYRGYAPGSACYVEEGNYRYDYSGVLYVTEGDDTLAYNVNAATMIVNYGNVGTVTDLQRLDGEDSLYVVYGRYGKVIAIFITDVEADYAAAILDNMTKNDTSRPLANVSVTYTVTKDVTITDAADIEAAVEKAVKSSDFVKFVEGLTKAKDVVVEATFVSEDRTLGTAVVTVEISTAGASYETTVTVELEEVEADDAE